MSLPDNFPLIATIRPQAPQGRCAGDAPVLWSWTPLGNDAAAREPWRIILLSILGLTGIICGIQWIFDGFDPDCTTRACQRRSTKGPFLVFAGLFTLVFPWLGSQWRTYLTGHYELTASHFQKTTMGKVVSFPLQDGRIAIRYNIAWFEPASGFRKRLTPIMPPREAKRLFEAVQRARTLAHSQEPRT